MKLLGFTLYLIGSYILSLSGFGPSTWQYWAIIIIFMLGGVFSSLEE